MHSMLLTYDKFGAEYHVTFNINRSKCLTCQPIRHAPGRRSQLPFSVAGADIENVSQWPQLDPIFINTQRTDIKDILWKRGFIGQVNNILLLFETRLYDII